MAVTPPPTLLQTVRDVPLESYHTDTLRRLIAQSRAVLRDRGLIPDASLRSRDTPDFTQSDCHAIRVAARRFACSPVALAEELLRLRAQPQIVTLHPREGSAARLTPLLRVHWSQRTGTVLTYRTAVLRFAVGLSLECARPSHRRIRAAAGGRATGQTGARQ